MIKINRKYNYIDIFLIDLNNQMIIVVIVDS